ncbi:MAG: hypothetical protein JWQ73_2953 [Variovorax sp.]|jgi:hypothetical protein|nr:hypothetical protein [Variovorax sp.]
MQIPDTDTSEYAALIEMAATGGRVRDERVARFAAVMAPSFWRQALKPSVVPSQRAENRPVIYRN